MPSIFEISGYKIYFWANESDEPIHVHVSKVKLLKNSTKVWLTKRGRCILANNNSKILSKDLNNILDVITSNYFFVIAQWKKFNSTDTVEFYC